MGRRQVQKGYERRQQDKKRERQQVLDRRARKREDIQARRKDVRYMGKDRAVDELMMEVSMLEKQSKQYKKSWEAEKMVSKELSEMNRYLRDKVKFLRLGMTAYIVGFWLMVFWVIIQ